MISWCQNLLSNSTCNRYITVTVDDYFPVKKGTKECMYMKPNGGELWVGLSLPGIRLVTWNVPAVID
jgi:hypothetical protein